MKDRYIYFLKQKIDNNFSSLDKYFEFDKNPLEKNFKQLNTLYDVIYENLQNLILENYLTSILLTSHTIEKFTKLTLVKYNLLNKKIGENDFNSSLENAYVDDNKDLFDNINKLYSYKLITHNEKKALLTLKNDLRNPYFHANSLKITKGLPNEVEAYHFTLGTNDPPLKTILNTKLPFLKNDQIQTIAKKKALSSFKSLYNIIKVVDHRLNKQEKIEAK